MSKIYNRLENDFTQISNTILTDTNITANAFRVYSYMCYRVGTNKHWDFFNKDMEDSINIGRDSLISAKNNLIKYGYLRKIGQEVKGSGKFGACDYEIFKEPSPEFPSSVEPSSENKSTNNTNISKDIFKRNNTITNHITPVDKMVSIKQEEYFLNFYESYPKKINKPNAEKTFNKLLSVNKKDIPTFIENITTGLEKYKELLFYRKTELQYIPNPQAWLNAAGWESIETYQAEIEQLKSQNNTNSYKNGNSYQQTETYTPKQPLNDDKNSKDYFSYRFNEDVSVAFGYQECIELTNSIIEQKPEFEKVARTKALLEWLKVETKSQYNTKIKSEVLDIYKKGGYDVFVSKAIEENPNSPWKSLLELLNN